MRRTVFVLFNLLILSVSYSVYADDEVWEIVEQCFGEAIQPPPDWTFEGTLLMTSPGRLHSYRQEWDTPRILVFSEGLPINGALSPDSRWYAVNEYEREDFDFSATFHEKALRIYSLVDDTQYSVPWENTFSIDRRQIGHRLYWLDNQHLLYSRGDTRRDQVWFRINPFTQEVELWEANLNPSEFIYELAPDATKALYTNWGLDYWILDAGEDDIQLPLWSVSGWSPDSSHFAAYTGAMFQAEQFVLFDGDGSLTQTLLDIPDDTQIRFLYGDLWSADGHHLLFTTDRLYMADIENRQILDFCISANELRSAVWSPNGEQFALTTYDRDAGIQIFDLETSGRYVVGYHDGNIIGWRADD